MVEKVLYSIVVSCKKGWRFGEASCLFNGIAIISVMLFFNILSTSIFAVGKEIALKFFFLYKSSPRFLPLIYPLTIHVLISIIYTKSKVLSIQLEGKQIKKYLISYYVYIALSIIFLIASILLG